jgi:hypothetical protein
LSFFSYRGLSLTPVKTHDYVKETVLSKDGVAYETQRHTLDISCLYDPVATAYMQVGNSNAALPAVTPGAMAPTTDIALRDWLSQPRGLLIYAVGTVTLLSTPAPGYTSDAANGPNVEVVTVKEIVGERLFMVRLRVTATVNEGPGVNVARTGGGNAQAFRVLLSNRWRQWTEQDDQYFVALCSEGEAVFRGDELRRRGAVPDNYRAAVMPPVPTNFSRIGIQVVPSEDGLRLHYRCVDRELAFNTPAGYGATRVEAYCTRSMVHPDAIGGIAAGLTATVPTAITFANSLSLRGVGTTQDSRDRMTRGLATAFGTTVSIARQTFPVLTATASAKAWGHRGSRRITLASLAVGICAARVGIGGPERTTTASLTQELSGKYVEFNISHTYVMVPLVRTVDPTADDGTLTNDPMEFVARVSGSDDTRELLRQASAANLAPPNSSGRRGSWPGQIAAAPLPSPHADPPPWPAFSDNTEQTLP